MKIRKTLAALSLALVLPTAVACTSTEATTSSTGTPQSSQTTESTDDTDNRSAGGGPDGAVDPSSVSTEDELIALIQQAYGDAGLGLHRGHEPVQNVLDEVLTISHDQL